MKVVLFCGGLGLRLRDYSQTIPKPMIRIGSMPLLWQVMKYYAHYGHKDFILCLGYQGEVKKALMELSPFTWDGGGLVLGRQIGRLDL